MADRQFKNRLLSQLRPSTLDLLLGKMSEVELSRKTVVIEADTLIEYTYFPETCSISILVAAEDELPIEIGMVGFEGMTDMAITAQENFSPLRFLVQMEGTAWRIRVADLFKIAVECPDLAEITNRFRHILALQFAFTAFSHGTFTIEERLARWLLMVRDRQSGDEILIAHEFLASMLAVRRAGITSATHMLEGHGAIRVTRGTIHVRDR